jgi:hypothetical protein
MMVKDYKKHTAGLILRHDIDASLKIAYDFAKLEKSLNVHSTYYILVSSSLYNIFSTRSKYYINYLIENGFEVGLHFDPQVYSKCDDIQLLEKMNMEIDILEKLFDITVHSYSMHQPSVHGTYMEHDSLINAYNSDIFHDDYYLSDSSFSYRDKNPEDFVLKSKNRLVQFLTHPQHFSESGIMSYKLPIEKILKEQKKDILFNYEGIPYFINECDSYKEILK